MGFPFTTLIGQKKDFMKAPKTLTNTPKKFIKKKFYLIKYK